MSKKDFIKQNNGIYVHIGGSFKIRERKGRNLEVQFTCRPGKWESTGTKKLEEAEAYANARLVNSGFANHHTVITLKEFAKDFYLRTDEKSIRVRNERHNNYYSETYYKQHQSRLVNYILPEFGSYQINKINSVMIENFYLALNSSRDCKKQLSDNSKTKVLDCFKIVMEEALRLNLVEANPCDRVERINQHHEKREIFTPAELKLLFPEDIEELLRIFDCDPKHPTNPLLFATYFSIAYDTGFRPGEILALNQQDFWGDGVYTKNSIEQGTGNLKNSIKTSRKGQDYKVGILSSYTKKLVSMHIATLPEGNNGYLFMMKGKFLRCESMNKHFKLALSRAGIEADGRTQYCLRHTFDTNMLNQLGGDMNVETVRELMAHTGYRAEYDHRTAEDIISKLGSVKEVIERVREA